MSWSEWDLLDEILNLLKLGSTHVLVYRIIVLIVVLIFFILCVLPVIIGFVIEIIQGT